MWVPVVAKACKTRELQTNVFFSILNNCSTGGGQLCGVGVQKAKDKLSAPKYFEQIPKPQELEMFSDLSKGVQL